jgi:hypothetical protein
MTLIGETGKVGSRRVLVLKTFPLTGNAQSAVLARRCSGLLQDRTQSLLRQPNSCVFLIDNSSVKPFRTGGLGVWKRGKEVRECRSGSVKNADTRSRPKNRLKSVLPVKRDVNSWMFHVTSQSAAKRVLTRDWADSVKCHRSLVAGRWL